MTTLASGLSLVLAAMLLSFQPYGFSREYQPVAESAGYFLLTAMEAAVLLVLLAACLLGDAVAGTSWLLLAVLPFAFLPSTVSLVNPMMHPVGAGTLAFGNISSWTSIFFWPSSRATWTTTCGVLSKAKPAGRVSGEHAARRGKMPAKGLF